MAATSRHAANGSPYCIGHSQHISISWAQLSCPRGGVPLAFARIFAIPAAYGDLVAAILAGVATLALAARAPWAIPIVWVFNVWGTLDLLHAIYDGQIGVGIDPGSLGAAFSSRQSLSRRYSFCTGSFLGSCCGQSSEAGPDETANHDHSAIGYCYQLTNLEDLPCAQATRPSRFARERPMGSRLHAWLASGVWILRCARGNWPAAARHPARAVQHPYQLSLKGRASTSNDHAERGCVVR